MKKDQFSLLIITAVILLFTIPFLNMGYHVDADWFMDIAEQILKDPFRAYSGYSDIGGFSGIIKDTPANSTPLVSYYLALIFLLFGRHEIVVHASYIPLYLMVGISFYYLAKRFVSKPLLTTLIMISTLSFVFMSHNIMLDVPMMGIFLLSVTFFVYGVDKNNNTLMILGSIFAALAYLAKPNGIVVIALIPLYAFIQKKYRYMGYFVIPVIMITLWSLMTYFLEGRIWILVHLPFLYALKSSLDPNIMMAYFFSNISYIGGATIFPLFFIYPFILEKKNRILLVIPLIFMIVTSLILYYLSFSFISGNYTILELSLFTFYTTAFIFFMLVVLREYHKNILNCFKSIFKNKNIKCNKNIFFLLLWFFGVYLFNTFISGGSAKYATLVAPPLVLVFALLLQKYSLRLKINYSKLLFIVFVITTPISMAVSYADYQFANVYRDFSRNVASTYKTENNTVWYNGLYGLRYYMREQNSPILLTKSNEPRQGDFIMVARIPSPRPFSNELKERIELVGTISYYGGIPIRTQNPDSHAGFYTYGGGFLPYSFSNATFENFDIYYVEK